MSNIFPFIYKTRTFSFCRRSFRTVGAAHVHAHSIVSNTYLLKRTNFPRSMKVDSLWAWIACGGSQLQFPGEWYKLNSKESKSIDTLYAYLSPKLFHRHIVHSAHNRQLNGMILCTNSLGRTINLNIRAHIQ